MRRPARLALIAIPAALALASAACGGSSGGSKPVIESFTATPGSLPFGGGQVAFHWSVKGASTLDLEPGVGLVTGTGATVAIGSSNTFTLTATNSHGVATATAPILVASTVTVHGRIVSAGTPAGMVVQVLGQGTAPALTDTNGEFTIPGVVPPYDIAAAISNGTTFAFVWRGLTRPDPTLESPFGFPVPTTRSGSISGTVAAGAMFPEASGVSTRVSLWGGHQIRGLIGADPTAATWSSGISWRGPSTIDLHLHAIEGQADPANPSRPFAFLRAGSTTATLSNTATVTGVDIPMSPISTGTLTGVVTTSAGFAHPSLNELVTYAPAGVAGPGFDPGDAMTVSSMQATNGGFSLAAPVIPNATITVLGLAFGPTGIAQASHSGLAPNATNADLAFPAPPVAELPLPGSIAGPDTVFAWTAPPGSVSTVILFGGPIEIFVMGTATTLTLPDLSEIGMAYPPSTTFNWQVVTYGPFASMDDAAGPAGLLAPPAAQAFAAQGLSSNFVTPP